jgi:hypothetical protein
MFGRDGSGSIYHSTIGTDVFAGTAASGDVALTYDTATVNGEVAIKVKMTNAAYTSVDGQVQLILNGGVQKMRKGT